ncbi:pseudaminic acid synthase [Thiomicrospira microaerophila]|uniref:pseudaminic acid synthase n=1 Tax=Thiomicrospira microaerophila TaxID=406020 RepID=UPI0005CB7123|nr:pseudaminic acid synthase [Thiomicrospira microaerophila]
MSISIAGRKIGPNQPPYIIAEMSANHNGDIQRAFDIISMAKRSGADAVKLQTYKPDTITYNSTAEDFMIRGGLWDGRNLYELYQSAYMPWEWHKPLFEFARQLDITLFSSPFDNTAVDLLEDLNAPAYKIASFEAIDLPLIEYVAQTGKPMIISTGMANQDEIAEAIATARDAGCRELAILHCVSGYPAPASDYNLKTLVDMQRRFAVPVGLSDHTLDNTTAIASVVLGGCIIEKHVTLDREGGSADDAFSLEEADLKSLCANAKTAWQALGKVDYGLQSSEKANIKFRRSLYFVKDILKGEVISAEHIKSIRPGYGLVPKYTKQVIGKIALLDIQAGTAVKWHHIEN